MHCGPIKVPIANGFVWTNPKSQINCGPVCERLPYALSYDRRVFRADVELIAPVGTEIIKVQAVDNDPQPCNAEVYYYVQSRVVGINRTTGLISLRENLHPRDRSLSVNLLAFDGGSPRRSARSKLTINVKIISGTRENYLIQALYSLMIILIRLSLRILLSIHIFTAIVNLWKCWYFLQCWDYYKCMHSFVQIKIIW